ncbi:hypothetical protein ACWKSP_38260 [Micromonosporaceae bacterium Da 78-11]
MFTETRELLSLRTLAILPIVLFTQTLFVAVVAPDSKISDATGILFHLAVLFLVSRLPGPVWAKAAGFGWLTLDVASGAMSLNDVPHDIAFPVRLGGHILAGVWVITVALLASSPSVRIVGVIVGLWLALYTFVGSVLPEILLAPAGILTLVWFGLVAWQAKPTTPALAT